MTTTISVTRDIKAPAEELWAMVADVTRMGEWSPETTSCVWLKGADGPAVGARFKGDNTTGEKSWSTACEVVECEPGASFVFDAMAGPIRYARWGYRFAPLDDGLTAVTEFTEDRRGRVMTFLSRFVSGVENRAEHNRASMTTTLERLAAAAES